MNGFPLVEIYMAFRDFLYIVLVCLKEPPPLKLYTVTWRSNLKSVLCVSFPRKPMVTLRTPKSGPGRFVPRLLHLGRLSSFWCECPRWASASCLGFLPVPSWYPGFLGLRVMPFALPLEGTELFFLVRRSRQCRGRPPFSHRQGTLMPELKIEVVIPPSLPHEDEPVREMRSAGEDTFQGQDIISS